MNKAGAFIIIAAALFTGVAAAQLAPTVSDAPIDITGDRLEVVDDVATWVGNVRAVQGEAILTAETLVADLDEAGAFRKIRAVGTVRYSNGKEAITGKVGVYDAEARTITISEDVVVTQGEQVMTGGELVYWVDTGRILFTAPSGRRIRGIFYAKQSGEQS
ncbi:MAG: LptA/OstA family protein [Pseudomonadota bacterium]